jgi:hypothetical protein
MFKILATKPEGRRSFERHKHRCEDSIKMDLKHRVYVDWIHLAQDKASSGLS